MTVRPPRPWAMRQTALMAAYAHLSEAEAVVQKAVKEGTADEAAQDTIQVRLAMANGWSQLAWACTGEGEK